MNFTREPIIETIISPREGNKLLVRNSKSGSGEEYYVDAVEVVSFGHAFFFRSLERPKSFLLPVSDYEIMEVKETRVALKHVSHERNIKIGGGKEASMRQAPRDQAPVREQEPIVAEEAQPAGEEGVLEAAIGARMDKRRDRRRHRRRRGGDEQEWSPRKPAESNDENAAQESQPATQGGGMDDEAKVSSPMFSALIPPPTTLISETIGRYKEKELEEEPKANKEVEKKEPEQKKKNPPEDSGESHSEPSVLNRVNADALSTQFTSIPGNDFFF